jgi:hypothetical protein
MDGIERYHKLLRLLIEEETNVRFNELRNEVYENFQLKERVIIDPDGDFIVDPDSTFIEAL